MTDKAAEKVSSEVAVPVEPTSSKDVLSQIANMASDTLNIYSTVTTDDLESKKLVLNAITNSEPIGDHLREKLELTNFVIQASTMIDDKTGEERDILRTILLTADGKAYHAVSDGLFKSLQTYTGLLGHPSTWEQPVAITVEQVRSRRGFNFFTIKLA